MSEDTLDSNTPPRKKSAKEAMKGSGLDQILSDTLDEMNRRPEKKEKAEVIIIQHETLWESLISDAGTFVMVLSLVGIGWLIGSNVLQWVGAIMFMICTITWTIRSYDERRMSIEDARKRLDEIEARMKETGLWHL